MPTPAFPEFAVYAVFDPTVRSVSDGPARIALLNLAVRDTTSDASAGSVVVDFTPYLRKGKAATLKRMTSPGLDSKDSEKATWAGQHFAYGTANGTEVVETLKNGTVTVHGSEGALLFF